MRSQYLPLAARQVSEFLKGDVIAGLTVGFMLIPQGLVTSSPPNLALALCILQVASHRLSLVLILNPTAGMAYALLAGVPPIYGLYASTWTLVAYSIFGSATSTH